MKIAGQFRLKLFGWGFGICRYFNGGAPFFPITWRWQLSFYWTWYHFWHKEKKGLWRYDRCFYSLDEHLATPQECAEYRRYMKAIRDKARDGFERLMAEPPK